MDKETRIILYKWINSDSLFDEVLGVIATGKANLFLFHFVNLRFSYYNFHFYSYFTF